MFKIKNSFRFKLMLFLSVSLFGSFSSKAMDIVAGAKDSDVSIATGKDVDNIEKEVSELLACSKRIFDVREHAKAERLAKIHKEITDSSWGMWVDDRGKPGAVARASRVRSLIIRYNLKKNGDCKPNIFDEKSERARLTDLVKDRNRIKKELASDE